MDAVGGWEAGHLEVDRVRRCRPGGDGHRLPAGDRRSAPGLRARPLRGLRGEDLPRAHRRASSIATWSANVAAVRRRRGCGRGAGRRARQPPDHGPGDPRPGRRCASRSRSTARTSPTRSRRTPSASCPTPGRAPTRRPGSWSARRTRPRALRDGAGPGLPARTRLGPARGRRPSLPPTPGAGGLRKLDGLAARLDRERPDAGEAEDSFGRDGPALAAALRSWGEGGPRVPVRRQAADQQGRGPAGGGLAADPSRAPRCGAAAPRILLIGFGAFGPGWRSWSTPWVAATSMPHARSPPRGRGLEGAEDAPLPILSGFLPIRPTAMRKRLARPRLGPIGGRLEHDEVADVMPAADDLRRCRAPCRRPSGWSPAESAACGVPPVSADHSGMREVAQLLADAVRARAGAAALLRGGRRARSRSSPIASTAGWRSSPSGASEAGLALAGRVRRALELGGVARRA